MPKATSVHFNTAKLTGFIAITVILMMIGAFFIGYSIVQNGISVHALVGFLGLLALLFNIVLVRLLKSLFVPSLVLLVELSAYLLVSTLFASEWTNVLTTMLWMLAIPMIAFFFLGFRRGLIFVSIVTALFLAVMAFRPIADDRPLTQTVPGNAMLVHATFGILYLFVIAFFALYERTQGIINRQLREANEGVRRSMEKLIRAERLAAIGEIASSIAHELRNPLGALKNVQYFLKMKLEKSGERDERLSQFLGIMEDEIATCGNIITNLLTYARDTKLSRAVVDLGRLLEKALETLAVPRGIRIEKRGMDAPHEASLDEGQMTIVISNILRNALQAMPNGGTLTITLRENADRREMEIRDTGIGIPSGMIGRIFEPLVSDKTGGTGLGLSISDKIVRAHGGEIKVVSESGKGSAFTIILPAAPRASGD